MLTEKGSICHDTVRFVSLSLSLSLMTSSLFVVLGLKEMQYLLL